MAATLEPPGMFHLAELLGAGAAASRDWSPFHPGVEICRLYDHAPEGPSAALLRYAPGAAVPAHAHGGYEHVFILEGEQQDHRGVYPAGTYVVNPPGSSHQVRSPKGCIVIVIWQRPVSLLG
jgi:anti-sigma factor ChrR (cupin superfamily)